MLSILRHVFFLALWVAIMVCVYHDYSLVKPTFPDTLICADIMAFCAGIMVYEYLKKNEFVDKIMS